MSSDKTDDQADRKTADDIDCKCGKWKATAKFRDHLPEQIAADGSECTAEPDDKQIHRTSSACRCAVSFISVTTAKPSSSKRILLTAVLS